VADDHRWWEDGDGVDQCPCHGPQVSVGSKAEGYPCPKDGATLTLITVHNGYSGAWCPECHTTWLEADEVPLKDLDALPEVPDA
jgi:hypothetical protein